MDEDYAISDATGIDISILKERKIPKSNIDIGIQEPEPEPEQVEIEKPVIVSRKLRTRPNRLKKQDTFWLNKRISFRDRALSIVNVDSYHENLIINEDIKKLLELSKSIQCSQLDKFTHDSRIFFVAAWLTTARIFEYHPTKNFYYEAKRIPHRYIDINSNLITSVHYCDTKLYIAYIANSSNETAFVEIRNLSSKLLDKPYHYDQIISSIESDELFIYIRTTNNTMHIHNKNNFNLLHYRADLDFITTGPIINFRATITSTNPFTKFDLSIATESSFIVSKMDALEHNIKQIYNLDPRYRTVSAQNVQRLILLHRNLVELEVSAPKSKIEIGVLTKIDRQTYFVYERCLSFECEIIQAEVDQDRIFLFGCKAGRYEVGCLSTGNFKPLWSKQVTNVDHNSKIIVQQDHVIVFRGNQQHFVMITSYDEEFDSILRDIQTEVNKSVSVSLE